MMYAGLNNGPKFGHGCRNLGKIKALRCQALEIRNHESIALNDLENAIYERVFQGKSDCGAGAYRQPQHGLASKEIIIESYELKRKPLRAALGERKSFHPAEYRTFVDIEVISWVPFSAVFFRQTRKRKNWQCRVADLSVACLETVFRHIKNETGTLVCFRDRNEHCIGLRTEGHAETVRIPRSPGGLR